jgi:hypothetical protein
VLRHAGEGYNIVLPFNMYENGLRYRGWRLYDTNLVEQTLNVLLKKKPVSYEELKNKIHNNQEYLAKPCIFYKD